MHRCRTALTFCVCLAVQPLSAQETPAEGRGGLTLVPSLGYATGAGNGFLDAAIGGGFFIGRFDLRLHYGGLIFSAGCATIVPTKCGDGGGEWYDGSIGFRFPDRKGPHAAWVISTSVGRANSRNTTTVGLLIGRDSPISKRWLFRIELYGRHLFDDYYEETWGEKHRQFGLRLGIGIWDPFK